MRKVSMTTRRELVAAVGERYRSSDREQKGRAPGLAIARKKID